MRCGRRQGGQIETRRIPVPPHRLTPLKDAWLAIFTPISEHMRLQIRSVGGGEEGGAGAGG